MPEDNSALVQQAQEGRREAVWQLAESNRKWVYGLVFGKICCHEETEDLVQEVFWRAYEYLPTLREPDRFATWLARIAANLCTSWWRRRKMQTREEVVEQVADSMQEIVLPDEQCERNEVVHMVREALDRMPFPYGEVMFLYYLEGYKCPEIARILGLNLFSVKPRLVEGRKLLRKELLIRGARKNRG